MERTRCDEMRPVIVMNTWCCCLELGWERLNACVRFRLQNYIASKILLQASPTIYELFPNSFGSISTDICKQDIDLEIQRLEGDYTPICNILAFFLQTNCPSGSQWLSKSIFLTNLRVRHSPLQWRTSMP